MTYSYEQPTMPGTVCQCGKPAYYAYADVGQWVPRDWEFVPMCDKCRETKRLESTGGLRK